MVDTNIEAFWIRHKTDLLKFFRITGVSPKLADHVGHIVVNIFTSHRRYVMILQTTETTKIFQGYMY